MNVNAIEYIPVSQQMARLWAMPFFQQRFTKAVYDFWRQDDAKLEDLVVLVDSNNAGFIAPLKKQSIGFLASYKGHVLVYETDRLSDPRTGFFRKLVTN